MSSWHSASLIKYRDNFTYSIFLNVSASFILRIWSIQLSLFFLLRVCFAVYRINSPNQHA
jgi:hypothetical protein